MTLHLDHSALTTTVAELRTVAAALESRRRRTDLAVDVLLDGGWSGRAASAYLEGWEEWRSGCDQVLAALASMADLIGAAHAEQTERDEAVSAGLRVLTGHVPATAAAS